jgi:phosphoglycolate phosphatase-like HAD superfamily hydrolase
MVFQPERIHALCFDVDGTLSDTDDMFVRRLVHWLMPFRFFFPDKKPAAFARRLVMATETPANLAFGLLDRLGIDDEIGRAGDYFYRLGLGSLPEPFLLIPGIQQMLHTLRSRYPLSIVSARGRRNTLRFLEQFQLSGFFTSIVTAHTCEHTKPHPDPILWAAKQMGVSPEECLMVGDTVIDIKAGKAAGAQTVGVLCGFGHEEELRQAGADLILSDTALLCDILGN